MKRVVKRKIDVTKDKQAKNKYEKRLSNICKLCPIHKAWLIYEPVCSN